MSANFSIRVATLDDLPHLLHHRRSMFTEMGYAEQDVETSLQGARSYFQAALPDGSCRAWVAEINGRVIGGGMIVFAHWPSVPGSSDPRRPWILNIYVEPEFRRRGIARAIMQTTIDFCRDEGFPFVSLHASDEGRLLYESMGFRRTNEMRLDLRALRSVGIARQAAVDQE